MIRGNDNNDAGNKGDDDGFGAFGGVSGHSFAVVDDGGINKIKRKEQEEKEEDNDDGWRFQVAAIVPKKSQVKRNKKRHLKYKRDYDVDGCPPLAK